MEKDYQTGTRKMTTVGRELTLIMATRWELVKKRLTYMNWIWKLNFQTRTDYQTRTGFDLGYHTRTGESLHKRTDLRIKPPDVKWADYQIGTNFENHTTRGELATIWEMDSNINF